MGHSDWDASDIELFCGHLRSKNRFADEFAEEVEPDEPDCD